MSLEPDGKVFALDGFGNALNSERLWNPGTGTFETVPYGRNLFCSGHIQLADGRTLLVGGHINANEGLADTTIFNPVTKTYFRGPDMSVGRWYPTATQLADGRVFTIAGDNIVQDRPGVDPPFSDASVNSLPSVYNPRTNTWTDLPGARLTSPLYPYLFVLSDGRIINVGPDKITRVIDPATWTLVDRRHEHLRRPQRRHVPPEQDHEGRDLGRPGLQRRELVQRRRPNCRPRHERADAGLALDGADGARALVPQPDAASRRHGLRQRRAVRL